MAAAPIFIGGFANRLRLRGRRSGDTDNRCYFQCDGLHCRISRACCHAAANAIFASESVSADPLAPCSSRTAEPVILQNHPAPTNMWRYADDQTATTNSTFQNERPLPLAKIKNPDAANGAAMELGPLRQVAYGNRSSVQSIRAERVRHTTRDY